MASLKLLNNLADPDIWFDLYGIQGMHHEVVDGKRVLLPTDGNQQNKVLQPYNDFGSLEFIAELLTETANPENMWMIEQNIRNMKDNQQYVSKLPGMVCQKAYTKVIPILEIERFMWNMQRK